MHWKKIFFFKIYLMFNLYFLIDEYRVHMRQMIQEILVPENS